MGVNVIFNAPADIPSLIEWFGSEAALISGAIKYGSYHSFSPACREGFASRCAELFPDHPRIQLVKNGEPQFKTTKETDESGNEVEVKNPILESEQDYFNRLLAAGVITKEAASVIMQQVADSVDPRPKAPAMRKPTKAAMEQAATLLAAWSNGSSDFATFKARWESMNSPAYPFTGDDEASQENVARALVLNQERKEREAGNEFM